MPHLQFFSYERRRGDSCQRFRIKKKDYGEMSLYDLFYEDTFLFTFSEEGKVLVSNWEDAAKEPAAMDEKTLQDIGRSIALEGGVGLIPE